MERHVQPPPQTRSLCGENTSPHISHPSTSSALTANRSWLHHWRRLVLRPRTAAYSNRAQAVTQKRFLCSRPPSHYIRRLTMLDGRTCLGDLAFRNLWTLSRICHEAESWWAVRRTSRSCSSRRRPSCAARTAAAPVVNKWHIKILVWVKN